MNSVTKITLGIALVLAIAAVPVATLDAQNTNVAMITFENHTSDILWFFVDGEEVGYALPGESIHKFVVPGMHKVMAKDFEGGFVKEKIKALANTENVWEIVDKNN